MLVMKLIVLICALNIYLIMTLAEDVIALYAADVNAELSYGWGVALPVLIVVLSLVAHAAVKKDDQLVKSADRLR